MPIQLIRANALDLPLADGSVDLVVTSPPYFGLRSYTDGGEHYSGQIGDEATPTEFVDALISATREMVRVTKPSGSIWVNLGDRFSPGMHLDREGMTMEDAAWLAGVIDSDGSISVHVNKQPEGRAPSFVPWMRVGQMRPEVVEQIAAVTGVGKVNKDGRGVWNWGASAQQAAGVLRLIWPWLHIKQRQALAAVELARHIGEARNKGTWNKVSSDDVAYRQSIREAVLDWNAGRPNDYQPPRLTKPNLTATRTFVESKSLIGIPWRYAIRCIDDLGLILRAEVCWNKPNGLPESVTDRVRRSHETWFHFTKQPRYYSAVDELRTAHKSTPGREGVGALGGQKLTRPVGPGSGSYNPLGALPGSVWSIPTEPLTVPDHLGVDHYAAFPMEWPRRLITGWSPAAICTACGEPRAPRYGGTGSTLGSRGTSARVVGHKRACPDTSAPSSPGVVLDPFGGTGTTALVADALGRHGISVDMSADYLRIAQWRTTDPRQRAKAAQRDYTPPPPLIEGQAAFLFAEETE